jgi:hypothetical protein
VYRSISISLLGLLLFFVPLAGQQQGSNKNRRDGFWFQAGLGGGSLKVSCDIQGVLQCSEETEMSGIARIALGGRISPFVHFGGSVDVWVKSADDVTVSYGATSLLVMIYPSPRQGFWFNLGPGYSMYQEEEPGAVLEVESFSVMGGLGYDFRVGSMLSLTPFIDGLYSFPGQIKLNGSTVPDSDASVRMLGVGLAVTLH